MSDTDEEPPNEPPTSQRINFKDLETIVEHQDETGTLLTGENGDAVLNPAMSLHTSPGKILYRVRKKINLQTKKDKEKPPQMTEYSVINVDDLITPTKVAGNPRQLLTSQDNYESYGVEDPRMFFTGGMAYVFAIGYDGLNARPFASVTSDFRDINRLGLIGLNISLEEAIRLLPRNSIYKKEWEKELKESQDRKKEFGLEAQIYPFDKDVCGGYINGKWRVYHRFGRHIQLAEANRLEDFQNRNFWEEWVKEIDKHTVLRAETNQLKIGLGQFPIEVNGRLIAPYHIVTGNENTKPKKIKYEGSYLEVNPETFKVISRLKDPLLLPDSERFIEYDQSGKERTHKQIIFPTVLIQDPENPETLITYYGLHDSEVGWRRFSKPWLLKSLSHKHNRISKAGH